MSKRHQLNQTFSLAEVDQLRALLHVEHEHREGQNECLICEQSLLQAASEEIADLRTALQEVANAVFPVEEKRSSAWLARAFRRHKATIDRARKWRMTQP